MRFAQYYQDYGPMMDGSDHHSWVGAMFSLFFLLVVVVIALYAVRALAGKHNTTSQRQEPLDIAKERFAKGEISKDEFSDIKKELK